ncbi:GvpL/GvpF family gas vesicle protein [Nocardia donostiensis]|uniref:Gas vesicle protein GvpFL n=1 Tax=Nocardia donostiensis TaxID=1538463 RepID=A0A1W0AYB8_9NOCA|nr:GvpL/GvpF family gas vesicle protein [Nocardia donostiensis]ONM47082.1 gas vesicle protein GvpFL [Nocardia donostiensis]OQS15247.1 gas vesicle protein GvpFL [Nocardia donostiensis]OQS20067.1 gas vesicle protein GvpFL [Nocardia donostiensis]
MTDGAGVWLYAVTSATASEPPEMTGIAGETVRTVVSDRLVAVVGSVPLAVFGAEPLRRNLEDLPWLEATARAHDAVVSAVARRGPTIPLRLATVYLDDARVRELLDERRPDFESALALVTGRTEWGVKAYGDRAALTTAVAEARAASSAKGAGTAYLLRRRAQLSAQETVEHDAAVRADEIHARLVRQAAAGRRQAATDPVLSGSRDWMVLNGTYLVDDERADEFAATVGELGKEYAGIRLEITGPWPPYSFAGVEREAV